ncbi:hypothetical protein BAE44_0000631 [Dichanthelium oligosanthes]|uniref:Uncharacterized protein n=1 Tax=Dichanthelium oligosanthes TaxID=888268 RepID=A0A1E5WMI8_9POAL|nr:hypothetical protein BAE44_0000631 [Dichanthelium oligosanthes]
MSARCECKAFVKAKWNKKKGYWFFERIRKAAAAREERQNDVKKLLEFFNEMKTHNEYFFYEVQVDSHNVIKNVFWSHASQRAEYRDFGCGCASTAADGCAAAAPVIALTSKLNSPCVVWTANAVTLP